MSKKITQEEFLSRFYRSYPESKIKLLNYTAISNPLTISCAKCGKEFSKLRARSFLTTFNCCGAHNEIKIEKLKKIYQNSTNFNFIKKINKDYFIVHCNKCGIDLKRNISSALDNPFACTYCNTIKIGNLLSIEEVQKQIDKRFYGTIQILDYNGQLQKNHYKCLKCGLIFTQQQTCLMQSRGCPKCDRFKSRGEIQTKQFLKSKSIAFKEQVKVKELPLQTFDFAIYDNDKLLGYIEVQGEQHFEKREIFRDSLEKIQERDNKKREYCKKNNIPLYELIYKKGIIANLDILPF